ncbi:MAG: DinB family protein [Desulfovibrio sp.]
MATTTGSKTAGEIRQKLEALTAVCREIDAATLSRAPEGRWSPREILSHILGAEGGYRPLFQAFLDADAPTLNIGVEKTYLSEEREAMDAEAFCNAIRQEYEAMAAFVEGLSEEELGRKARIPQLKQSPLSEYPTLGALIAGLGSYHLQFHIDHLREVLDALAAQEKA